MMMYVKKPEGLVKVPFSPGMPIPVDTIWIDLYNLTREEESGVEKFLKIGIPTREEMSEIEVSNRLYQENNALYMIATIVTKANTAESETHAFTFILCANKLVTIRYQDPQPFQLFSAQVPNLPVTQHSGPALFVSLVEVIINRIADILEYIGQNIDNLTKKIFCNVNGGGKPDFQVILQQIGQMGDLVSKTHESLVTINRMIGFASQHSDIFPQMEFPPRMSSMAKDIIALSDHASFLVNKVNFLLDATLGMISIEQNNIIKIFSVSAVVFLPPTLIASIYGMNFGHMPELHWQFGYPFAIGLMALCSWLPYKYFKRKKWL